MSNTLKIANRDLLDHVERLKCQPQPNEDLAPKIGSLALNTSGMSRYVHAKLSACIIIVLTSFLYRSDSSIRNESMYPDGQVDLLQEARSLLEESFPSSPTLDIEKDLELKIPSIQASPPARLSPKIEFLESSLDELSRIQKQLVDQNAELRKNASDAESKLKARAERIQALERSLKDSHERLDSHKASSIIETGRIVKPIRGGLHVTNDLSSRTGVRGDANATKSKWYVNLVTTNTRRP